MRGTYYQISKIGMVLLASFVAGIGFDAPADSGRAHAQAILLIGIQALIALYCLFITFAGDRIEGFIAGLEAVFQSSKLWCDYAASNIDQAYIAAALANADYRNAKREMLRPAGGKDDPEPSRPRDAPPRTATATLAKRAEPAEHPLKMRQNKKTMVVLTNASERRAKVALECLGLTKCFRDVFGASFLKASPKPKPEAFRATLDAVGVTDPSRAVLFEDSLKNIRACRALGMRCVFIEEEVGGEAALLGDAARAGDADLYEAKIRRIADLKKAAPWLWEKVKV